MTKGRLEAFSDGVIAIIITVMVLELKVPHDAQFSSLAGLVPDLSSYVLSFVMVGIYWNNHHHMFQAVRKISGAVLWANLHLLFWLSLVPFVTSWMGQNNFSLVPVLAYGVVLLACAVAFSILVRFLIAANGSDSAFAKAIGRDWKSNVSLGLYVVALGLMFVHPLLAIAAYGVVAVIWFVPDRRFERITPAHEA